MGNLEPSSFLLDKFVFTRYACYDVSSVAVVLGKGLEVDGLEQDTTDTRHFACVAADWQMGKGVEGYIWVRVLIMATCFGRTGLDRRETRR